MQRSATKNVISQLQFCSQEKNKIDKDQGVQMQVKMKSFVISFTKLFSSC
jgi:hypothetical protein